MAVTPPPLSDADRRAVLAAAAQWAPLDEAAFAPLLARMQARDLAAGEDWLRPGDAPARECLVLTGILHSWVGDAEGRAVTLAFHVGPGAVTPSIARTADGRSRVHCQALTPARIVLFDANALVQCMVQQPGVQCWGDAVLRADLVGRADREWALAALPARERLLDFRRRHPGLEDAVPHRLIASHLGMTPVSLSRLRAQLKS